MKTALAHCSGHLRVFQMIVQSLCRILTPFSPANLSSSAGMPSIPGDFPFFRPRVVCLTSSSRMSGSISSPHTPSCFLFVVRYFCIAFLCIPLFQLSHNSQHYCSINCYLSYSSDVFFVLMLVPLFS